MAHAVSHLLTTLLVLSWLAGCASVVPQTAALHGAWPADLPPGADLAQVPFHPQRDYECGPAALAMALEDAGAKVTLAQLIEQVYVPGRQGSLQVEMLAGPRRYGMVSYQLAPRFEDVLREVAAGTPVIVLQNHGVSPFDVWHYAVVAGYDGTAGEVVLRSGETRRLTLPFAAFEYVWKKGGHWAMVVTPPQRVPATATETRYVEAVAAMERVVKGEAAAAAYRAAIARWPGSVLARIALANRLHEQDDLAGAVTVLREAERLAPDSAVVLNNLAQALSDQGQHQEGLVLVERALQMESPFNAAMQATRTTILERMKPTVAR